MPEGPSIVILKENIAQFAGEEVVAASGNTSIDLDRLIHKKVNFIKSWGKHLLIGFDGFTVRIHLLMFGSYSVNETSPTKKVRLGLEFKSGYVNFYTCSVKVLEGDINKDYDWTADVMSDDWSARKAKSKLNEIPQELICDALLDQDLFSGVGNIIKNEVLYLARIHPESIVGKIPSKKIAEIIRLARDYSFDFLTWKKEFSLKKHWLAYSQKICRRCDLPFKKADTGKKNAAVFIAPTARSCTID